MPISTPRHLADLHQDPRHFDHVLNYLFLPALQQAGFQPWLSRSTGADLIHGEIIHALHDADLVLADLSTLNLNVLFELGIRTAVNRPACLVLDDTTPAPPFDVMIINCHRYRSRLATWQVAGEIRALAEHLRITAMKSEGCNAMWQQLATRNV